MSRPEQALLGALLYDNGAYERLSDSLKPEHFYEPFHGRLFAAIELNIRRGQLADPTLLSEQFQRDAAFQELGCGVRYLADLVDRAPHAAKAADYARVIYDLALRRELIRIGGDIAQKADVGDPDLTARDQIEAAEQQLYTLGFETGSTSRRPDRLRRRPGPGRGGEMAAEAYNRDGGLSGLSTGLSDLDQKLGGLHPSDLVILASRPSMGKSSLCANIAFNVARRYLWEPQPDGTPQDRQRRGGGLSSPWKWSAAQMATRLLARRSAACRPTRSRKGEITAVEFGRIRDAATEIQESPLYIDDTGGISISKMAARARRLKRSVGLDLIVVDYLQLMTVGGGARVENRVQEVSQITQGLKALAKELNVPVIAAAQLSRQVENREDKRPAAGRFARIRVHRAGRRRGDVDLPRVLLPDAAPSRKRRHRRAPGVAGTDGSDGQCRRDHHRQAATRPPSGR